MAARQEHQTSRENAQIPHSLTADPVPVTSILPQQDSSAPDEQWRRVSATGRYLPDAQVLARLRVVEGEPAFEVLVPFAVDGGPTVLVDRGYVRPEQGSRVPRSRRHRGEGDHHRAASRFEPLARARSRSSVGVQQVYSINTEADRLRHRSAVGVPYLQLVEDQPGGLGVIGLPHLDAGHSSPMASSGSRSESWRRSASATSCTPRCGAPTEKAAHERDGTPDAPFTTEAKARRTVTADDAEDNRTERSGHCTARTAAPPARDRRTPAPGRRRGSAGSRARSAYWVGPPSRMPRAPAKAASTTPAFGLGWRARRAARRARAARATARPAVRTSDRPAVTRAARWLATSSNGLRPSRIGRSAASGGRSSRRGVGPAVDQHPGNAADGSPQQRRHLRIGGVLGDDSSAAREAGRIQRGRVATAQRRQQLPGAHPVASTERSAIRSPARVSDVPPSATNNVAAVPAAVPACPSARGRPLHGEAHHGEGPEQRGGEETARLGVGGLNAKAEATRPNSATGCPGRGRGTPDRPARLSDSRDAATRRGANNLQRLTR